MEINKMKVVDNELKLKQDIKLQQEKELVKLLTNKEICYFKMINRFYITCSKDNIEKMINIIEENSNISLRVLDWFVTKYSKKRIDCGNIQDIEVFDVRISYKAQLKAYKKKYFDPFRRKQRFKFYYTSKEGVENTSILTTLGQLNFFKWAISNNIIAYVEKNLELITKSMNVANKNKKLEKKELELELEKKQDIELEQKSDTSSESKSDLEIPNKCNIELIFD